eukprot:7947293-Alexandrium_andersonii.AAC.1
MDFAHSMGMWEKVPRPPNVKAIGARWVGANNGDDQTPNYRSRLVAKDVRRGAVADFFAAMPPSPAA